MSVPNLHVESASVHPTSNNRGMPAARDGKSLRLDRATVRVLRVATGIRTGGSYVSATQ